MDPRTEFSSLERDRSPDEASGLARLRRIDRLCHHASSLSRKFQRTVRWAKPLRPSAGSSPAGASPPRRCAPSYLLVPPPPGPSSAQPDYPRIGIGCLRAKQIGACAIDQQPSQILIAAFGYPAQADFAAGRVLSWHETHPRRKLAPAAEIARLHNRRRDGRGDDRPDPGMVANCWLTRLLLC